MLGLRPAAASKHVSLAVVMVATADAGRHVSLAVVIAAAVETRGGVDGVLGLCLLAHRVIGSGGL